MVFFFLVPRYVANGNKLRWNLRVDLDDGHFGGGRCEAGDRSCCEGAEGTTEGSRDGLKSGRFELIGG